MNILFNGQIPLREEDGGANKMIKAIKILKTIGVSETFGVIKAVGVVNIVRLRQLGYKEDKILGKWLIQCKTK